MQNFCTLLALCLVWLLPTDFVCRAKAERPNIVLIYADDMGIDSVSAFNDKLGLTTPHLDRLAAEGTSFMDAHSTSGVCSPSRYSLLTGRYHWRSRLKSGIVGKWERPLIEHDRLTLASMLKQHGYTTRMIGKWHLGHDWPKRGGGTTAKQAEIDFTGSISGGPNAIGFDYWFGDDVPNWPPYAWRENDRLLGKITTTSKALLLTENYVGVSDGPAVADWSLEAVLPEYAKRCGRFIRDQANSEEPFFLYFAMPSPHTPIAPNEQWKGKSGVSAYADLLLETDWAVGELLQALDESEQTNDTLVIFTTDNGTSPKAEFAQLNAAGVHLTEHWRGNKADVFEGGHRVPLIVRWPGRVDGGRRSHQLVVQTDMLATVAGVIGHELAPNAGEDSCSMLPALLENDDTPIHKAVVHHSISGHFAVSDGRWKVLFCRGSGGWSAPREAEAAKQGLPPVQLYELEVDPKETTNVADRYPETVRRLTNVLRLYVESGRSTDGPPQENHNGQTQWGHLPWN